MSSNIDAFKAALAVLGSAMDDPAAAAIEAEAEGLERAMRAKAQAHSRSGATVKSIQVVRVRAGKVRIVAGGDLTTKEVRQGSGVPYDHVRAEEFGTKDMKAIPFFFNTYREQKRAIVQRVTGAMRKAIDL